MLLFIATIEEPEIRSRLEKLYEAYEQEMHRQAFYVQEEIHTEDPEERAKLEEERTRENTIRQVFTALFLALIIWVIMGLAALML